MTVHYCTPPVDPIDDPDTWVCPSCSRVWERREEDEPEYCDTWYQPAVG